MDQLRLLEEIKAAAAAAQARVAVAFDISQRREQQHAGLPAQQVGAGIAAQIALARRDSPHRGGRHLGLARALVGEMPHTLAALTAGQISEWRATVLVRETACLSRPDRSQVDARAGRRPGRARGPRGRGGGGRGAAGRLPARPARVHRPRRQGRPGPHRHAAAGSGHHDLSDRPAPGPPGGGGPHPRPDHGRHPGRAGHRAGHRAGRPGPDRAGHDRPLCEACNHTKDTPGWRARPLRDDTGTIMVQTTPTGHVYLSHPPRPAGSPPGEATTPTAHTQPPPQPPPPPPPPPARIIRLDVYYRDGILVA